MSTEQQSRNEAYKELKLKHQQDSNLLANLRSQLSLLSESRDKYRESASRDREKVVELEEINKAMSSRIRDMETESSKNFKELGIIKQELQEANEDRSLLNKRFSKLGNASSKSEYEEEIRAYKKMLICSVCDIRQKSAIITSCCHIFCRECISENLKSRNRRCPQCKKMFGENDVNSIYF